MREHLTDEQLADFLAGEGDGSTRAHLEACGTCREEAESLRRVLVRYGETARGAAERPGGFWRWQQSAIAARLGEQPAGRLAWAAGGVAFAAVAIAVLLSQQGPGLRDSPAVFEGSLFQWRSPTDGLLRSSAEDFLRAPRLGEFYFPIDSALHGEKAGKRQARKP